MDNLTIAEEMLVNEQIAKETIERLGYDPEPSYVKKLVNAIVQLEEEIKGSLISRKPAF